MESQLETIETRTHSFQLLSFLTSVCCQLIFLQHTWCCLNHQKCLVSVCSPVVLTSHVWAGFGFMLVNSLCGTQKECICRNTILKPLEIIQWLIKNAFHLSSFVSSHQCSEQKRKQGKWRTDYLFFLKWLILTVFLIFFRSGRDLLDASPRCGEDEVSHIFKIKNSCNTFTKWLLIRTPFQSTSALNPLGGHLHLCCEVPSIPGPPAQHAKPVLQSTFKQAKTNAKSLRRFVENEMHHLPIYSSHNVKVRCFLFLSHFSFFLPRYLI